MVLDCSCPMLDVDFGIGAKLSASTDALSPAERTVASENSLAQVPITSDRLSERAIDSYIINCTDVRSMDSTRTAFE